MHNHHDVLFQDLRPLSTCIERDERLGKEVNFTMDIKSFLGTSCDSTRQTETSVFATGQAVWSKHIINSPHTSQQGPVMKLKKYESLKISSLVMSERVYSSWRSCSSSPPSSSGVSAERLWIPWEESSSMISSSDMLITDTRWRGEKIDL